MAIGASPILCLMLNGKIVPRPDEIALLLARIAREAGRILARMQPQNPAPELKSDSSPVTAADRASETLILRELGLHFPDIPIVSEENAASHVAPASQRFFLVDPLDGTRAFIAGTADFCVLLALIEDGVPVAGAIHAPIADETVWAGEALWQASGDPGAATPLRSGPARAPGRPMIGIASKLHGDAGTDRVLADHGVAEVIRMSSALKFIRMARGEADFYPRLSRTMQWDIAAGDAILRVGGGGILDPEGRLMRYGFGAQGWASPSFTAFRSLGDAEYRSGR